MEDDRVQVVKTHMCRYGMTSHMSGRSGDRGLVKKATGFMTSARLVVARLNKQCTGDHDHVHLKNYAMPSPRV